MLKKSSVTFRWPLIFFALLSFISGVWQYFDTPPQWFEIYGKEPKTLKISGYANMYTPPQGAPRIKIINDEQKIIFLDCLIAIEVCSKGADAKPIRVEATVVRVKYDFYWPIEAQFLFDKRLNLDSANSKLLFDIYREREHRFYKFWLLLSLALAGFAIWFGKRSLIGVNRQSMQ